MQDNATNTKLVALSVLIFIFQKIAADFSKNHIGQTFLVCLPPSRRVTPKHQFSQVKVSLSLHRSSPLFLQSNIFSSLYFWFVTESKRSWSSLCRYCYAILTIQFSKCDKVFQIIGRFLIFLIISSNFSYNQKAIFCLLIFNCLKVSKY